MKDISLFILQWILIALLLVIVVFGYRDGLERDTMLKYYSGAVGLDLYGLEKCKCFSTCTDSCLFECSNAQSRVDQVRSLFPQDKCGNIIRDHEKYLFEVYENCTGKPASNETISNFFYAGEKSPFGDQIILDRSVCVWNYTGCSS